MSIEGKVLVDKKQVGTFVVDQHDRHDQLIVDFNGGRWTVAEVFFWAREQGKSLVFVPDNERKVAT